MLGFNHGWFSSEMIADSIKHLILQLLLSYTAIWNGLDFLPVKFLLNEQGKL